MGTTTSRTTTTSTTITTSTTTSTTTTSTTSTSTMSTTTTTPALPCASDDDCQDNAGCFADEVNIDPLDPVIHTICHCFLGFVVDNSTADFPKTGTCNNLRTAECDDSSEVNCYEDEDLWGVCPYCRAFKHHVDHGGELDLGHYVGGEGGFLEGDPMIFEGGDDTNCNGVFLCKITEEVNPFRVGQVLSVMFFYFSCFLLEDMEPLQFLFSSGILLPELLLELCELLGIVCPGGQGKAQPASKDDIVHGVCAPC